MNNMSDEEQKSAAGRRAAAFVHDGMRVGLGTGSTVRHTILELGRRIEQGLRIEGVPTSRATQSLAEDLGIPLRSPDEVERLDITIDGADEFDPGFALIKGGGGALLREKIIAQMSDAFVVVADASKQVSILGAFSVPVEIVAYGWERTADAIRQALEAPVVLRRRPTSGSYSTGDVRIEASDAGGPFVTDNGNLILDVHVGPTLVDPKGTEACLHGIAGVVEAGLFVGMCDAVVLAGEAGVSVLTSPHTRLDPTA